MSVAIKLLVVAIAAAIGTLLVVIGAAAGHEGSLLLMGVLAGGFVGGFIAALIGGEKYGLRLPGNTGENWNPGFLGDAFVGTVAAVMGMAFLSTQVDSVWATSGKISLLDLWTRDFGAAVAFGFAGLKVIRKFAGDLLDQATLEETHRLATEVSGDSAFLKATEAMRGRQYEEAEALFHQAQLLDGDKNIRSLVGLARAQRWRGNIGDALATLGQAITTPYQEQNRNRLQVAYWNRACYKTIATRDLDRDIEAIISDLTEALKRQPDYKEDLRSDDDLKKLQGNPKFEEFCNGVGAPPKRD